MSNIQKNMAEIRERIATAAKRAGKNANDITLLCVTKTIEEARIAEVLAEGATDLGENKVQELERKMPLFPHARWHMIGHLQTNKVKTVAALDCMIHSIDRLAVVLELEKRMAQLGKTKDVLMEINIANEKDKFGVSKEEAVEFAKMIVEKPHLRLCGLMCVAPMQNGSETGETNRKYFSQMRELLIDISHQIGDNGSMQYLSMGMTGDYEVAIEEGANIVRIGTGLFGQRVTNIV